MHSLWVPPPTPSCVFQFVIHCVPCEFLLTFPLHLLWVPQFPFRPMLRAFIVREIHLGSPCVSQTFHGRFLQRVFGSCFLIFCNKSRSNGSSGASRKICRAFSFVTSRVSYALNGTFPCSFNISNVSPYSCPVIPVNPTKCKCVLLCIAESFPQGFFSHNVIRGFNPLHLAFHLLFPVRPVFSLLRRTT